MTTTHDNLTRRQILAGVAGLTTMGVAAAQPLAPQTGSPARTPVRGLVPRQDLVNVLEYEAQAARVLPPDLHALVAGSQRADFDRITLHPRMMVPALGLDLGITLFGDRMFAPLLVAPMAGQRRFHDAGERATHEGAAAAHTIPIVSSHASSPLTDLVAADEGPFWYQVFASDDDAPRRVREGVAAGAHAIVVTVGSRITGDYRIRTSSPGRDWNAVPALRRAAGTVPVLVKGALTPDDVARAHRSNLQGVIASPHRADGADDDTALILSLPALVEAAAGMPILVDGSFRRGTDILKALAFGARAVLVGRPVLWGLAAYGVEGVQGVLEMLQTELARYMAMSGAPAIADLSPAMLRVHPVRPETGGRRG